MPKPHVVVLNYEPDSPDTKDKKKLFGPDQPRLEVGPRDTIAFRVGKPTADAFKGCRLKITLDNPGLFSPKDPMKQTSGEDLVLTVEPKSAEVLEAAAVGPDRIITGYRCELFDANDKLLFEAHGPTGGEIVPGQGGGANA